MKPEAIIIQRPSIDFAAFLGAALEVLGHSPGAAADASTVQLTDTSRFISCLAAMRDSQARVDLNPKLLAHVTFSLMIVAGEPDMMDLLECAAGMPFVTAETKARGVLLAVVTGTLAQWKAAVIAGSGVDNEPTVRYMFNRIYGLLCDEGLNLWTDCQQRRAPDQVTFLLEDKRGH